MMKKFVLKNKSGEIINQVKVSTLNEAEKYFAEVKNISIEALLDIYIVAMV